MAVSEQARRRLHEALETQLGEEEAATLMESLPPIGWGDVATQRDLRHLAELTQRDLAAARGEFRESLAAVRGELREGLAAVRGELQAVRVEFHHELRVHLLAILGAQVGMVGLFGAMVKLFVGS